MGRLVELLAFNPIHWKKGDPPIAKSVNVTYRYLSYFHLWPIPARLFFLPATS